MRVAGLWTQNIGRALSGYYELKVSIDDLYDA